MLETTPEACSRLGGVAALREQNGVFVWQPEPLVLVISGPSGAGKDSVVRRLCEMNPNLHFVVTATSRPMRPGERDGVDYHFLTREEFARRLDRGEFIEHAIVYGEHKGVLRSELTDALARGTDVIMRVDVQGARALKHMLPDAVFVFVIAESEEEHLHRLRLRGSEDEQSLSDRRAKLREEMACLPEFDYLIINRRGCLDETAKQLLAITTAEKSRVRQRRQRVK